MSNARFSVVQAKAVRDRRVTDSIFRTLSALGMYSDENGWCFPKQSTIAEDTGKSRQTVNEHIGLLVDWGYLEKRSQFREDGSQTSNLYRLLFDTPVSSLEATPPVNSGVDTNNDPLNDPSNNTASGENQPSADKIPFDVSSAGIEWQILSGRKELHVHDDREAQMVDTADIIATGMGKLSEYAYNLSLSFMRTRGIIIPKTSYNKERKAVKELSEMGVLPEHVEEATRQLAGNPKLTGIVSLHSVKNVAFALANPAPENYEGSIDGV